MHILHHVVAPNGVMAALHRVWRIEFNSDIAVATVNSFSENSPAMIGWQESHVVPVSSIDGNPVTAVHNWLVSPQGPFPGGQLMNDPTELESARANAWARIKQIREAVETRGCEAPLGRVDTDPQSQLRIAGAVQAASLAKASGGAFLLDWTMADNSAVPHDADQMIAMGIAVMMHVNACHEWARGVRGAIEAAETVETVNSAADSSLPPS